MHRIVLPFQKMTPAAWRNIAVVGLLLFYLVQVAADVLWGNLFGNLGADFAAFWSAGHVANTLGYPLVYDLEIMRQVQSSILPPLARALVDVRTIPVPFLPVFLLPLQALALLAPKTAFVVWSLFNLGAAASYLYRFMSRLAATPDDGRVLLLCMASAPFFQNAFLGQANLWLMVCVGESLLALRAGSSVRSGVWLAGVLLKPQMLVLVVPALLLNRRFKAIASFALGAAAIVGGSWLLGGSESMRGVTRLWLGYAEGLPTNDIQLMMNWRMLVLHGGSLLGQTARWIILAAGTAVTCALALSLWIRRGPANGIPLAAAWVGLWAATASVAWHSHVHSAVVLMPPLLMLAYFQPDAGRRILNTWVLIPAAAFVARLGFAMFARLNVLQPGAYAWIDSLGALAQLGVNLWLLIIAVQLSRIPASIRSTPNTN